MIMPVRVTTPEAELRIREQIRINATEAGEFVQSIYIADRQRQSDGFTAWTAFYLPGPPGPLPLLEG